MLPESAQSGGMQAQYRLHSTVPGRACGHKLLIDHWEHGGDGNKHDLVYYCRRCDVTGYREAFDGSAMALDSMLGLPMKVAAMGDRLKDDEHRLNAPQHTNEREYSEDRNYA